MKKKIFMFITIISIFFIGFLLLFSIYFFSVYRDIGVEANSTEVEEIVLSLFIFNIFLILFLALLLVMILFLLRESERTSMSVRAQ